MLWASAEAPLKHHVTLIATNPETVDGLNDYLRGAGVETDAQRGLTAAPAATAVVVFPDELDSGEVSRWLVGLRAARPALRIVLITGRPQELKPALQPDGHSVLPVVLPKPAFGWTILDAIRGHARQEPPV